MGWFDKPKKEERQKRQETCGYCGGSGKVTCSECGGSGDKGAPWHFTCTSCDGSGEVYCGVCGGCGYTEE